MTTGFDPSQSMEPPIQGQNDPDPIAEDKGRPLVDPDKLERDEEAARAAATPAKEKQPFVFDPKDPQHVEAMKPYFEAAVIYEREQRQAAAERQRQEKELEKRRAAEMTEEDRLIDRAIEEEIKAAYPNADAATLKALKATSLTGARLGAILAEKKAASREAMREQREADRDRAEFFKENPRLQPYEAEIRELVERPLKDRPWPLEAAILEMERKHPELRGKTQSQADHRPRDYDRGDYMEDPAGGDAAPVSSGHGNDGVRKLLSDLEKASSVDALIESAGKWPKGKRRSW
jgi:hypothetical protein